MANKAKATQARKVHKAAPKKGASIVEREVEAKLSVGVRELRQDASKILNLVKSGESVIVTEWGKPVAEIRPLKITSLQDLINAGIATAPTEKFDPKLWEPIPNPKKIDLLAELLKEREEARY
jgi:prevent-host-death family protein